MIGMQDFVRALGPRVLEVRPGILSPLVRFDNGVYLRLEPLAKAMGVRLEFRLFLGSRGELLAPSMSEVSRHMRGWSGYRAIKSVRLHATSKGATAEDLAALEDVATALAGTSARAVVWEPRRFQGSSPDTPAWVAGADFWVVGDMMGWSKPLDYSAVPPRVVGAVDRVQRFLQHCTPAPPSPP